MSKAILISIKPKWVAKILNGEKTLELRKSFPKDYRGWVYIYCTKADDLCKICKISRDRYIRGKDYDNRDFPHLHSGYNGRGKVVARFWCDRVLPIIKIIESWGLYYYTCQTERFYYNPDKLTSQSCLNTNQIEDYLGDKNGFAIHFSTLEIFDRPKELSEFNTLQRAKATDCGYLKQCKNCGKRFNRCHLLKPLTKAPQSWMYVEEEPQ